MSYCLRYKGVYYKLDATSSISVNYPARTTSHPTHSRQQSSDNYVLDNPTATVVGVITDVKTATSLNKLSTGDYIDELLRIRGLRVPVEFQHRLDGALEDSWFITSFSPSQDQTLGFSGVDVDGNVVQAFKVNMTLERVVIATGLRADVVVPPAYLNDLQEKSKSSKSTLSVEEGTSDGDIARAKAAELRATLNN